MVLLIPWLLCVLPLLTLAWDTQCYAPNGDKASRNFAPCISIKDEFSMCCRINDTNPDVCYDNGLCYLEGSDRYHRDYCNDPDWKSPNCLKNVCTDENDGGSANGIAEVHLCPNEKWCCGSSNACCTDDKMFTLDSPLVTLGGKATATTTITATATSTTGSGGTSSSTKVAIGAGVGVPLGILAIAMLAAGFLWGRRNTAARYEAVRNDYQARVMPEAASSEVKSIQETEANPARSELPAGDEEMRPRY